MPLSKDEAKALLAEVANKTPTKRTKADPTQVRELAVWFKLNHRYRVEGCENPDCVDTRNKDDKGRRIVAEVQGKMICRPCFLTGYLLIDNA